MPNTAQIKAAINDPNRNLHERLILEWKWRDKIRLAQPRHAMWSLLELVDDDTLTNLERAFPQEVMALRLARATWAVSSLITEGLLLPADSS